MKIRLSKCRLAVSHSKVSFTFMASHTLSPCGSCHLSAWYKAVLKRQEEGNGGDKWGRNSSAFLHCDFSHLCHLMCLKKPCVHVQACENVRVNLHTNVDLTPMCASVLYLFSRNKNTLLLFVMTHLIQTTLTPASSALSLAAVRFQ